MFPIRGPRALRARGVPRRGFLCCWIATCWAYFSRAVGLHLGEFGEVPDGQRRARFVHCLSRGQRPSPFVTHIRLSTSRLIRR